MKTTNFLKKTVAAIAAFSLVLGISSCSNNDGKKDSTVGKETEKTIKLSIGATPVPHAEILLVVKDILARENIELSIVEYTDYVIPNTAVDQGENDANFFQHITYLNNFNEENNTSLVSVANVHFEPLSIYPGKSKSLADIPDGATIAIPNDPTNEARSLLLLQQEGFITIKEGKGLTATPQDIIDNPKNLQFKELEAAIVSQALTEVDFGIINGNYALSAGLTAADSLACESVGSEAVTAYVNVIAVKAGSENRPEIKALIAAVTSDEVREFIQSTYGVSVVPVF